jgi:hypothetical protein
VKRLLIVVGVLALLPVAPAAASPFVLGSSYNELTFDFDGVRYTGIGAGSYDVSRLNGSNLPWAYCVDLLHEIRPDSSYPNTGVSTNGVVNGSYVNNADKVAWLLATYAASAAGNSAMEAALQAVIWQVIYGSTFTFRPTPAQAGYFALWSSSSIQSGDVSKYLWLTPESGCTGGYGAPACVQGLVTYQPVPEPGSRLLLLGAGLVGLKLWRKRLD